MAGIITDIAETGELSFVTERFAVAEGRLEVLGHWRGVRGRRFVRPVLWLHADGTRRRLVAVLDHKPWAAADGTPWVAAFQWDGPDRIDAERAELEVGRELFVDLPVPGGARPPRKPSEAARLRRELAAAREEATALRAALDGARTETESARADGERMVNQEYQQRERALLAAEQNARSARGAEEAVALLERQLSAARASHAGLEERLAAAEAEHKRLRAAAGDDRTALEARLVSTEVDRDQYRAAAERLEARLAAAEADRDRLRAAAERLEVAGVDQARLETAEADRDRLRHALAATEAERARLERDVASARADRERVEAELVATRAPARQAPPLDGSSRLATPRSGPGLWLVRLVALALVVALFAAVAVIVAGVA